MTRGSIYVKIRAFRQILIPAALRQKLGITPGVEVIFEEDDGILLLHTRESALRRAQEYFGKFSDGPSVMSSK
jgi:AbrB family looped-hinge helix DNA binding protein